MSATSGCVALLVVVVVGVTMVGVPAKVAPGPTLKVGFDDNIFVAMETLFPILGVGEDEFKSTGVSLITGA